MSGSTLVTLSQAAIAAGLILTALGGYGVYHFSKVQEREEFESAKPTLDIEGIHLNDNVFAIIIKTKGGEREVIEKLNIEYTINGLVKAAYPRGNIYNSEKPEIEIRNHLTVNDRPVIHHVVVKCRDVLPGALNGVVVEYVETNANVVFDERIKADMFWTYGGKTQQETMYFDRKSL